MSYVDTAYCPANHWEPGLGPCICKGRVHSLSFTVDLDGTINLGDCDLLSDGEFMVVVPA